MSSTEALHILQETEDRNKSFDCSYILTVDIDRDEVFQTIIRAIESSGSSVVKKAFDKRERSAGKCKSVRSSLRLGKAATVSPPSIVFQEGSTSI